MITTINMSDDQVTAIVVEDLKRSYILSLSFAENDPDAAADAEAIKRVLDYYMVPSDKEEFFNELEKHSKHYFDLDRNK